MWFMRDKVITMKKKIFSFVMLSIVVISLFSGSCIYFNRGTFVETKEMAIEIAKEHVMQKYGKSFDDYEVIAVLNDSVWIVGYIKTDENNGFVIAGGGGPQVKIKQSSGRVIECLLQA